jgi:predicted Zn-dependent protease/transglutaminase-like putative cysteine protease
MLKRVSLNRKSRLQSLFALALILASTPGCPGQAKTSVPSTQPAAPSYNEEALVVEKAETVYRYEADSTGEKDVHERIRIQSEAGARQFSVLSLPYASANESPQIERVVVYHPDGSTTETPTSDAIAMPAPVTQMAPLYSDLKQLQIPVRGLRAGDVLEYWVRIQRKNPEAPSQFWDSYGFEKNAVTLSETLTFDVPAEKYVQVWSPDRKPVITEKDGRRVYVWTGSQLKPTSAQPKKEAFAPPTEFKPDVAWTTFHSWEEVGEWYRALAAPRMVPTDALRAQAEEITRDAKSPLEQVQALYSFVSTHIRYVGIDFGIGRYQPHMPAEVLANQYGDCKDKDTLLEALLHAKGFTTAPALIGANLAMVPELPSPAFFNHVITTVSMPQGRIWMDSTPGVAPFQLLMSTIRDKQALVIPPSGSAGLERTPAETPYPFVDSFEATAALDISGNLNGKVKISYRSDMEILMRLIGQSLAPAQWDQGAQEIANMLGFSGTTSNSNFGRADDTNQPMVVNYDYTRKSYGDWDNLRIVPLFPALTLTLPMAPEKQPESEIELGALRTENVISRIQLPAGYSAQLPDAVHTKTDFATCDVTYKLENGEFTAQRTLVVLQSRLPAAAWEQYQKFTKDISLGDLVWVQLDAPARAGNSAANSAQPGTSNADAGSLIREALVFETKSDWNSAQAKLDEAKKLNPEQPFLWSNYGYLAMRQNRFDDAREDLRHELAHHPEESFVVSLYARMLIGHGDSDEAQVVLKAYFDRDPTDQQIDLMLASIQARNSVPDAIATLRHASDALPDHPLLQTALANYLITNHQEADAAALMEKLLAAKIDDPNVLNDAAYALAQANTGLPLAEEQSRKSIEILAGESADAEVSEANPAAFQRASLAAASWDTLGFILLKEGKLDEARDYLEAAWRNQPESEVSLHYGRLQEAVGDIKEAMRIYAMAPPPRSSNLESFTALAYEEIRKRMERLEAEGVAPPKLDPAALQRERTFKLTLLAMNSYWSATYRLQLDASGIDEAMQVSGPTRQGVVQAIKQLSLPHLAPNEFKGFIVRDAVVSCSAGKTECEFVLMPMSGISAERATQRESPRATARPGAR